MTVAQFTQQEWTPLRLADFLQRFHGTINDQGIFYKDILLTSTANLPPAVRNYIQRNLNGGRVALVMNPNPIQNAQYDDLARSVIDQHRHGNPEYAEILQRFQNSQVAHLRNNQRAQEVAQMKTEIGRYMMNHNNWVPEASVIFEASKKANLYSTACVKTHLAATFASQITRRIATLMNFNGAVNRANQPAVMAFYTAISSLVSGTQWEKFVLRCYNVAVRVRVRFATGGALAQRDFENRIDGFF